MQSTFKPAIDRFNALENDRQEIFKSTLARFNRIYAFITQVCRLFDKDIHKFSVYAKFLLTMLPSGGGNQISVDDKILLEYYRLEKEFEGDIALESTEEGFRPITGEAGRREKKKDTLTSIIDNINEKYGTNFREMDKVLLQFANDYITDEKWQSIAANNKQETFMMLFKNDFPNTVATRYEMNEEFFVRLFNDENMMREIVSLLGPMVYKQLNKSKRGKSHSA